MKSFKSILCASLLTLAMSVAAFGGEIHGRTGEIHGAPGEIHGEAALGEIHGLLDEFTGLIFGALIP